MSDHTNVQTTLVLGGTGKTGRRVTQRLLARGLPTRTGSRAGRPPFDWDDPGTWGPVLSDVAAVYVAFHPDLAVPGAAATVGAFAEQAVAQGVRRLVLLSGRGEEGAQAGEQAVQRAGAEWTVLRASWFDQNFSEGFLLDQVLDGEVALPAGDVAEPFVDVEDIADMAVAALTGDGHAGQVYELTGPRLLRFVDAIGEIAAASGRDIRYVPVTSEQFAGALREDDVPADVVSLMTYLFTEVLDGRNAHLDDGVRRALGREPRDFTEYARAAAASGVWTARPQPAGSPGVRRKL